ncbi:MAG TPA: cellulase family glycosylhydrolase, partial [Phycisphaerae bacterium]|nr:cellulase family glycosylhydrolase [Phycisphaerae bacterium]
MTTQIRLLALGIGLAAAGPWVMAPVRAAAPPEKPAPAAERWPADKARDWYQQVPRPCGFNFLPSTAVNTTEMWQADTFDAATIDRELGWAEAIGFNSCRVFLQYLVWQADPERFLERFDRFLGIAAKHRISVMPVLFDDCAFSGKEPYLGKQDAPVPGVHNSGWTASPGHSRVVDRKAWPDLERYVTQVVGRFASDRRVIAWDLYNEPTNGAIGDRSLPLAEATFAWARRAGPSQPITLGVWNGNAKLNRIALDLSDIVTFHNYGGPDAVRRHIADL